MNLREESVRNSDFWSGVNTCVRSETSPLSQTNRKSACLLPKCADLSRMRLTVWNQTEERTVIHDFLCSDCSILTQGETSRRSSEANAAPLHATFSQLQLQRAQTPPPAAACSTRLKQTLGVTHLQAAVHRRSVWQQVCACGRCGCQPLPHLGGGGESQQEMSHACCFYTRSESDCSSASLSCSPLSEAPPLLARPRPQSRPPPQPCCFSKPLQTELGTSRTWPGAR